MYFCEKCYYIFDITKSSKVTKEDNRKVISKFVEALAKLEAGEDLSQYKGEFSKEEMGKNKKYQKLNDTDKIKLNQLFDEMVASGAEFKCENCNYSKMITETTLLYQINLEDKVATIRSLEENELMTHDPLLPHTHDYTCKNPNCTTHKNPETKDAVFFREKKSYKVNYICTKCFFNW